MIVDSHPRKRQDFNSDFFGSESNNFENFERVAAAQEAAQGGNAGKNGNGNGGGKIGYSAGSGLRSIAQGSADQANNAVQNQPIAANQAAYVAKNTLAQAAAAVSHITLHYI